MAVPGPPVTLRSVYTEFGAPVGTPLNQFGRGGPWVPDLPPNAGVPLQGNPIRLAQLAGATKYTPPVISGPNSVNMVINQLSASAHYSVAYGTGSYTITWTKLSNTGIAININSTTTLDPTFSRANSNFDCEAIWQLKVTDGISTTTLNVDVSGAGIN